MKKANEKTKVRRVPFEEIPDEAKSKVKQSKNAYEITTMKWPSKPPNFKKLTGGIWVNTETGEAVIPEKHEYKSSESLSKTFKRMRDIITHNFTADNSELFLTLTFDKQITDSKELGKQFKKFWKKLNYRQEKDYSPPYRCLAVVEFQQNGNYHFHCLLKRLDGEKLSIPYSVLMKLWDNGTVKSKYIYNKKGLANYLNAFYVRKKRWSVDCYPIDLKIYRCYGNFETIAKIDSEHGKAIQEAEKQGYIFDDSSAVEISITDEDESEFVVNKIQKESFIMKQKK